MQTYLDYIYKDKNVGDCIKPQRTIAKETGLTNHKCQQLKNKLSDKEILDSNSIKTKLKVNKEEAINILSKKI